MQSAANNHALGLWLNGCITGDKLFSTSFMLAEVCYKQLHCKAECIDTIGNSIFFSGNYTLFYYFVIRAKDKVQ